MATQLREDGSLLLEGQWIEVQKKTFTRWANTFLSERMLKIGDLAADLADGVLLLNLLELISRKSLGKYNKNAKMQIQKLENLKKCLDFVKSEGLTLVNIGASDIEEKNLKIILGLIWTLILRYQIQGGIEEGSPKWDLLQWVRKQVEPYNIPEVKNFTTSWIDGKTLSALTDSLKPGVIDMRHLGEPVASTDHAMEVAEHEYQIPRILDAIDMVEHPDEHSIMTYVSYFRDYQQKRKDLEELERQRKLKTADPSKCRAYGPGLEGGYNFEELPFTIEAVNYFGDKLPTGGDDFHIEVTGPEHPQVHRQDNNDGTHSCHYKVAEPGNYQVAISLRGDPIKDSPWHVKVDGPDASRCTASGPGVEGGRTRQENPFTVVSRNKEGSEVHHGGDPFVAKITGPEHENVHVEVHDNGNGTYTGSYTPTKPGHYHVEVSLRGKPIHSSPFDVLHEGSNAHQSWAEGPGLEGGKTGRSLPFTIHGVDADGNPLNEGNDPFVVDIHGPTGHLKPAVHDNHDGTYNVEYTPEAPGDYKVDITLHGKPIKDSPFHASVKQAPDASKSYAEGPGLEGAFDNEPTYFTVHAFDEHGKPVSGDDCKVTIQGPSHVTPHVVDNGDGTYKVSYHADKAGDYTINATLDDEQISGLPKNVSVQEGAESDLCGVGSFTFTVHAKNKHGEFKTYGGDRWEVSVRGPEDSEVHVKAVDHNDGQYSATYSLEGKGKFKVVAKLNGKEISGSPFFHKL